MKLQLLAFENQNWMIQSSEIQIENYDLICSDRNRHGGGVACFIRNDLSYNTRSFLPSEIENIFIEIFLPHSKPFVVGTVYHPPSQGSFTKTITEHFSKINISDTEIYILGDSNIDVFSKQKYIFHLHGLEQLTKSPTRVTYSTFSLIDHILTTFPERVSQQGIIDVGLSDHQLIYCTRKFSGTKLGTLDKSHFAQ